MPEGQRWISHTQILQEGTDALRQEAKTIGNDAQYQIPQSWRAKCKQDNIIQSARPDLKEIDLFQQWLASNGQRIRQETYLYTPRTITHSRSMEPTLYGPKRTRDGDIRYLRHVM